MATTITRRVLFVDDEMPFLETIARAAARWSNGRWEVLLAPGASEAMPIIQDQAIDLVVIDVQMPVVDGIQFLNLIHRKYPNLQKVALTGFATDEYRAACLAAGAELFLEKPVQSEGFTTLLNTLDGLIKRQPEEGFRGVLRQVGLPEIIQLECLSRHSTLLEIVAAGMRGTIFIHEGDIVHAVTGAESGQAAINRLLALSGVEFQFKPFVEPPARTIHESHEAVLMEAVRQRDEGAIRAAGRAAPAPESAPAVAAAAPPAMGSAAPRWAGQWAARELTEVLLCTAQGEVLYEWQCHRSEARVNFLEFVSSKALQLAQAAGLGQFERLELDHQTERVVVRIRPDWGVFARTRVPAAKQEEPPA